MPTPATRLSSHGRLLPALLPALLMILLGACQAPPSPPWSDAALGHAWERYKSTFVAPEGYVHDPVRDGGEVTSEGQAYAMLRAVWLDDRQTFERLLAWTEAHLRRSDGLLSWRWRPRADLPGGGILLDSGTASDADQDFALALILASRRFQRPDLLDAARRSLVGLRSHCAIPAPGGWLPAAGNWAVAERLVNPSYCLPYAYPYFQAVDPDGRWLDAGRACGELLRRTQQAFALPPDFVRLDADGQPKALEPGARFSSDFSYDAVRVFYRMALTELLFPGSDALAGAGPALQAWTARAADILLSDGRIVSRYAPDGRPLQGIESPSLYGALLPALQRHAPQAARLVLERKLRPAALETLWADPAHYYDANWVWFGLAGLQDGLIQHHTPRPEELGPPGSGRATP